MNKIICYIRVSTDEQDLNNQKLEIYEYAKKNNFKLEELEFIEVIASTKKSEEDRKIDYLLEKLNKGDVLVVTELSRLGRSTIGIISLIDKLLKKEIYFISIKQNLNLYKQDINSKIIIFIFSLCAELERDLISMRTKEAMAYKKSLGIHCGKPKGTIQKSKFDPYKDKIKELLDMGLSARKICRYLNFRNAVSLNNYINKVKLR